MIKFLADENISPQTVALIRDNGYDIVSVREIGLKGRSDKEIVKFAVNDKRTIITFDLDYGEMYYFSTKDSMSIIVVRSKSQWVENVNPILLTLLKSGKLEAEEFRDSLVIVTENKYRVRKRAVTGM